MPGIICHNSIKLINFITYENSFDEFPLSALFTIELFQQITTTTTTTMTFLVLIVINTSSYSAITKKRPTAWTKIYSYSRTVKRENWNNIFFLLWSQTLNVFHFKKKMHQRPKIVCTFFELGFYSLVPFHSALVHKITVFCWNNNCIFTVYTHRVHKIFFKLHFSF